MVMKVIPISSGRTPAPAFEGGTLRDTLGRSMHDLRISVTDRCNFRCVYCMPREVFDANYTFLPHSAILSFEEIARLARIFVGLGVEKIRLTGGEPLVRRDLHRLVAMLKELDVELTLTTNGSLLAKNAQALAGAGLDRVTVSLDSLDEATFRAMNDVDFPVAKVLESIDAAAAAGLSPVKVNMVVKRGVNDGDILPMAERWRGSGHIARFIEYMDVGSSNGWRMDDVVPSAEVVRRISERWPLEPVGANYAGEVAARKGEAALVAEERASEMIALDEALRELAEISPEQSRIVELRFFGGLTIEETAELMKLSVDKVKRDWTMAKTWLYHELKKGG